jgi:hypothetical protein
MSGPCQSIAIPAVYRLSLVWELSRPISRPIRIAYSNGLLLIAHRTVALVHLHLPVVPLSLLKL